MNKRVELLIQRNTKHGQAGTPTYVVWKGMVARCECPSNTSYKWYGAKGVTVCERWHDFKNFFEDMGEAPIGSQLHRLNGYKVYSKETCQWVSENEHIGLHNTERGWGARLTRAQLIERVAALNQELTAERQRREEAEDMVLFARSQLLSALAAIEKALKVAELNIGDRWDDEIIDILSKNDLSLLHQHAAKQAEIDEARAQRNWLIKECARVGVTVNVQIGASITEAYRLVNNAAEVRKPLVDALTELYIGRKGELDLPEWAKGLIDYALAKVKE